MKNGSFVIEAKEGNARAGTLQTAHGVIETPAFMPVGTKASVKSLDPHILEDLGAQIVLGNTYHLYLAPGDQRIRDLGGLHQFMQWDHPILTDSGGFQVFSLGAGKKDSSRASQVGDREEEIIPEAHVTEDGVEFRSHKDGSDHFFTPEKAMEIQANLGADIIMAFDECPPYPSTPEYYGESMQRTHRWLERCIARKKELESNWSNKANGSNGTHPADQLLFGIVQGGTIQELREESARFVASKNLPGIAIGGVANGNEAKALQMQQVQWAMPHLPHSVPHYLMGIGTPLDLAEFVNLGIDMFDCVLPTRLARNGAFWTTTLSSLRRQGSRVRADVSKLDSRLRGNDSHKGMRAQIKNAQFTDDPAPLMQTCACSTCRRFSRAYLHHLFMENEPLGMQLLSIHNLHMLLDEMRQIRARIQAGTFASYLKQIRTIWT